MALSSGPCSDYVDGVGVVRTVHLLQELHFLAHRHAVERLGVVEACRIEEDLSGLSRGANATPARPERVDELGNVPFNQSIPSPGRPRVPWAGRRWPAAS